MRELYGVDMELTQRSKLITELPPVDIVVTMGCNVNCPHLPCRHREDWGLEDPTDRGDAAFRETIAAIHQRVLSLRERPVSYTHLVLWSCASCSVLPQAPVRGE